MSETTISLRGREMSVERIDERIQELKAEIVRLEEKRVLVSSPGYKEAKEERKAKAVASFAKKSDNLALLLKSLPKDVLANILQNIGG